MPAIIAWNILVCGACAEPANWALNASNTRVEVSMTPIILPRVSGGFGRLRGRIAVDPASGARSTLEVVAEVESMTVSMPSLHDYLLGEPVFNAARFPTLTFLSSGFTWTDALHGRIAGALTMRGVTHPLDLDVALDMREGRLLGLSLNGSLNRLDYGMTVGYPLVTSHVDIGVTSRVDRQ